MKLNIISIISLSIPLFLPVSGSGAELGTRQQTIRPIALPTNTLEISLSAISDYAIYGYSAWQWGPGENEGQRLDLMTNGYTRATNAARLLSYFSISDIHITDKESPAESLYVGWSAPFGAGGLYASAYSPVVLSTTHVLDAAVKTVNALHRQTPFDFGICLGDVANSSQYNELRWFIDVMDGQSITPSSGAHLGDTNIDYQMPYQAAGLNRSIPWYQVIGNHDEFWMGTYYPDDKLRNAMVDINILNITNGYLPPNMDGTGQYVGVVDGTTPYGVVIKGGPTNLYATPPTVVADTNRHTLTMATSSNTISCTNFMSEFFHTASSPAGHGFTQGNIQSNWACYSFEPLTNMPIKVIVLDDTCKSIISNGGPISGFGWIDTARYAWLTNELQMGQNSNQLMILACHIPINPQAGESGGDLFDTNNTRRQFWVTNQASFPGFYTEAQLIATLHNYPNLILLMAGHSHLNVVTPQPSPDPTNHPEYGFWEVETPSLRDFPQQFRTWEILRNSDNSISILTTDVDPVVEPGSPADKSRGYAIGAARISGGKASFTDTSSHAYNAELIKQLTTNMQAKIAGYGAPLGHRADWSFVMLGDTRGDDNTATGVSPYLNIIAQKIAALNPQLVMMAGDLCNGNCLNTNSPLYPAGGDFTNAAAYSIYAGEFANWKTAMQPIFNYSTGSGIPIYTVRGNHENEDGEHAPISGLKQAYYDAFSAYVPANGPSNSLADDQRGFSWSFTHSNVTFVAADQYFNYTNASPDQLSGYHSLDRAWVTQQFQETNSPYKIFMAHEPIFQTEGNGPGEMANGEAQHFFGTNAAALQVRADFWNALGTNGVQLYLTGHLHLETVANTTNDYGNTIIQLTAGNGGAPPQPFIDNPEPGVTTLFNNGNTLVISNGHASVNGIFGFSLATVQDDFMTIQYYSLNTNDNSWTVADFVTQIAGYGGPLGHRVSIDRNGTGVVINFIGKLQSADTILGPWTNVTNTSPYTVTATNSAKFYRAAE